MNLKRKTGIAVYIIFAKMKFEKNDFLFFGKK